MNTDWITPLNYWSAAICLFQTFLTKADSATFPTSTEHSNPIIPKHPGRCGRNMATPDSPDLLITNSENIIYLESGQKKPASVIWMLHRLSIHLKMKYLSLLCILMLIFSGCNHPKDEILFSSSRPGNSDIYLMDVRTTTMHQLTDGASEEWAPVWISKEEIAFLSQQDDSITIQKLHIPTRKITGLPHPANCILNDKNYVYSDKSDKRLYLCDGDIFLLHDDNHTPVNLTENITGTANYPAWGADDTILTFTSNH
jgi:hypothetical protein